MIYLKKAAKFRELRVFVSEGYFLAMQRKLTTKPAPLLLYVISFFKPSSLFFLIPHS